MRINSIRLHNGRSDHQNFTTVGKCKVKVNFINSKIINRRLNIGSSFIALWGRGLDLIDLESTWTFTNSILVLKQLFGNRVTPDIQRKAQEGERKHTTLTLLSSPYLIISWANSSVGLTRTNAWTFFLEPILAKEKRKMKFSVVIIKQRGWIIHQEKSDMHSTVSCPSESQSPFPPEHLSPLSTGHSPTSMSTFLFSITDPKETKMQSKNNAPFGG